MGKDWFSRVVSFGKVVVCHLVIFVHMVCSLGLVLIAIC